MDSADTRVLLERATARILGEIPGLLAVYVFGSLASGERSPHSDLDVAVLGQQPMDPQKLYGLARDLEAQLDIDVDLIDLLEASTVLVLQVVTTGRLLFNADRNRVLDFEARSLSEYGHFRERNSPDFDSVLQSDLDLLCQSSESIARSRG